MRGGGRQRGGQNAPHLRPRLQRDAEPIPAAGHARAHRVGHRPVPRLPGGARPGGAAGSRRATLSAPRPPSRPPPRCWSAPAMWWTRSACRCGSGTPSGTTTRTGASPTAGRGRGPEGNPREGHWGLGTPPSGDTAVGETPHPPRERPSVGESLSGRDQMPDQDRTPLPPPPPGPGCPPPIPGETSPRVKPSSWGTTLWERPPPRERTHPPG